jgi:hypothetical protein
VTLIVHSAKRELIQGQWDDLYGQSYFIFERLRCALDDARLISAVTRALAAPGLSRTVRSTAHKVLDGPEPTALVATRGDQAGTLLRAQLSILATTLPLLIRELDAGWPNRLLV